MRSQNQNRDVVFCELNMETEEFEAIRLEYGIHHYPTFLVFLHGNEVLPMRYEGPSRAEFRDLVNRLLQRVQHTHMQQPSTQPPKTTNFSPSAPCGAEMPTYDGEPEVEYNETEGSMEDMGMEDCFEDMWFDEDGYEDEEDDTTSQLEGFANWSLS
uniref:Protein disulfide isomerase-like 5-1 n=1 Tax=Lygus hesperus TaxID=30085 RepID=A0A0A9WRU3_LYGHE